MSAIASLRLLLASSRVRPWPFAPGISGQKATNQSPSCSMIAVNSLCIAVNCTSVLCHHCFAILDLVQLPIQPLLLHQLLVRPAFADFAVVEDEDRVGRPNRRQAVGDDD